jgi:CHASE2 domain-containing sensor protein
MELEITPSQRILGALLFPVAALACYFLLFVGGMQRLSYDVPFLYHRSRPPADAVLVYLDDASLKALGQASNAPMDRSLHTRLLDRLTRDGVKAVYYDIIFNSPGLSPAVDQDFAAAIARNGHVILGAMMDKSTVQGVYQQNIYPPTPVLLKAAAAWGLVGFLLFDPDYAVRRLDVGDKKSPTASWAAAQLLNAPVTLDPTNRAQQRWLNYYGPPGSFASVSFYEALQDDGVPPGFFKDKVVFIGGRPSAGSLIASRDAFANPYSRWGGLFFNGVEVHATEFVNLMHGDWLTRMPGPAEIILLLICGAIIGVLSNFLPPSLGMAGNAILAVVVTCCAFFLQWYCRIWFNWLIAVLILVPLGIVWSVAMHYFFTGKVRARRL